MTNENYAIPETTQDTDDNNYDYKVNKVLNNLQRVYRFRLNPPDLPSTFVKPFSQAVPALYNTSFFSPKIGIAEEVGDLMYQILKLICAKDGILTNENQKKLYDIYKDKITGHRVNADIGSIYKRAYDIIEQDSVQKLSSYLPQEQFPHAKKIAKDFLAEQYVAYISRSINLSRSVGIYTDAAGDFNFHNVDFIKKRRIPEETAELVEVLHAYEDKDTNDISLAGVKQDVIFSYRLVYLVEDLLLHDAAPGKLFVFLESLVKQKVKPSLSLEDIIDFCLFKIKGRQELTFSDVDHRTVMHICKPAEYLMGANMVR